MNLEEASEISRALGAAMGKRAGKKIGEAIAHALYRQEVSHKDEMSRARQGERRRIAEKLRSRQRQGFESTDEIFQVLGELANEIERMPDQLP